jgi:uncharacterized membrane protein YbhN (UPF0104 family)
MKLLRYISPIVAIMGIIIGGIALLFHCSVITISNYFFIVGLLLVIIGCICLIAKGHLFTGWKIFHRKGDNERFENEKIPAREIGRLKNSKIVVNLPARNTLLVGLIWIIFAILITL